MAAVVNVSGAGIGSYDPNVLATDVVRIVVEAGGQYSTAEPMLWATDIADIERFHYEVGPAPDLDYYVIPNAILSGGGALPKMGDSYVAAPTVLPAYVTHFIAHDIDNEYWEHEEDTQPIRLRHGISIMHNNIVFGHWLMEMFPKLLMLKEHMSHFRDVPIIIPSSAPGYVRSILRETLGNWPVVIYRRAEQHVEVENLIMPSMFQDSYHFHPKFSDALERHVQWARRSVGARLRRLFRRNSRRIFVSRRGVVSSFRRLDNIDALEAVAGRHGLEVVQPEKLSWRRQVELFSYADLIVGEFGSGMHNTLFSPTGARVICLNWIVEVQSRVTNLRRQSIGYVLPPDGKPRLFAINGKMTQYEIDPESLDRTLAPFADR